MHLITYVKFAFLTIFIIVNLNEAIYSEVPFISNHSNAGKSENILESIKPGTPQPDFDFGLVDPVCANNNTGKLSVVHFDIPLASYSYTWSNGATTQTINNLSAGTYTVTVTNTTTTVTNTKSIILYNTVTPPLVNIGCADEVLNTYNLSGDTRCVNNNGRVFRVGNLLDNYYKTYGCSSQPGMNPWPDWLQIQTGTMIEYANGTARIQMTIFSECDTTLRFTVQARLSNKVNSTAANPLTNDQCTASPINDTNWFYYREVQGYMVGLNQLSGGIVYFDIFNGADYPAQFGYGGSGTTQFSQYGSESWHNGYVVSGPTTGVPFLLKSGTGRRMDWQFAFNGPLLNNDNYCKNTCSGDNTTLQSNAYSPYNLTYLWTDGSTNQNMTVAPSSTTTYTVTVTDTYGCSETESFILTVNSTIPTILSSSPAERCGAGSVILSAVASLGTVRWFNSATGGTPLHTGTFFNTSSISASTTFYAEAIDAGCISANRTPVLATINSVPSPSISGNLNICQGSTTTLTASSGGTYLWNNGSTQNNITIATHDNYTVTVTNSSGCTASSSVFVNVNNNPGISIDYNGTPCITETALLSVQVNSGLAPFGFNWSGPAGFTGSTQNINISNAGNYYVTVTDANNCSSSASGFVYERYEPFIVTLSTDVCEGESVNLSVNSPSAVSYFWSANAGNSTSSSVIVFPSAPSTSYQVTVTNNVGCTATPDVTINVSPNPIVSITGGNTICVGQQTTLSPSSGGTWVSNNPFVATINSAGIVTGINGGAVSFTFTNNTSGCSSLPSPAVNVNSKPVATISGPSNICVGSTTQANPNINGTWVSSAPSVATISNAGLITGIAPGTASFVYTNTSTGCMSDASNNINVIASTSITLNGPSTVCVQSTVTIAPSVLGGNWSSSNSSIAYVNEFGMVTGLNPGSAIITYTYNAGPCLVTVTKNIDVLVRPQVNIVGNTTLCTGETSFLSPSSGGTWVSSAPSVASVTNEGVVTALSDGTAHFVFTATATGCSSPSTGLITVNAKPLVILNGNAAICIGAQTSFSPSSGGTWISGNPTVASINNFGIVTGLNTGTAKFIFISSNGCASDSTGVITVGSKPILSIDYHGSLCLTDTSQLSVLVSNGTPNFTYQWTGPSGFTGTTQTISIPNNGTYRVTVSDSFGCQASTTAFINQRYEPVVLGSGTTVCEGQNVNLQVSASNVVSFLWSANAGNATTQSVTVSPGVPSSTYHVTVTNSIGCTTSVSAVINVNPKPATTLTGNNAICAGLTTTFTPSTGGIWTSTNPTVATISNNGVVTGMSPGTATFIFTDYNGCISNPSQPITINPRPITSILGPNILCQGSTVNLSPNSGGTWTSTNNAVATVSNSGLVSAINQGNVNFIFTDSGTGCTSINNLNLSVINKPTVFIIGDDNVCIGSNTQLHPSSGGSWLSNHPGVATVNNNGLVTGIAAGTATFTFIDGASGCVSLPTNPIIVHPRPLISLTGPSAICIGGTTSLSPSTGGFWVSSNTSVASVNSSGIVTGNFPGTATFIFTEFTNYCSSEPSTAVTVNPRPVVSITGSNLICIGQTTTLSPSIGGTWTSNHPSIASVTNSGLVTALAPGVATFRFTNTTTGCISNNTPAVTINNNPTVTLLGPGNICVNGITLLSPVSGGTWASSNPAIAIVSNSGVVNGMAPGSVFFTFTETNSGCASTLPIPIQVYQIPAITLAGTDSICIGGSTFFTPSSGGTWVSMNPTIASVTTNGVVTGLNSGAARFYFVDAGTGCHSNPSDFITINESPLITPLSPTLCKGATININMAEQGTWLSSNPSIASITNAGLVTGINPGYARFVFTSQLTGCSSDSSGFIQILPLPNIILSGPSSVCIGNNTQLAPTTGGVWNALFPSIATINNAGLAEGVSQGVGKFTFTQISTNCTSSDTISIIVNALPVISISGDNEICIGENTNLSPSSGGTWQALNASIASVNGSGLVTGLSQGVANFRFVLSSTGCAAVTSSPVLVHGKPVVSIQGPAEICVNGTTQLSPSTGGSWISEFPSVASVSNSGVVTGNSSGIVRFIYTNDQTTCSSDYTLPIEVSAPKTITNLGRDTICLGYKTQLTTGYVGVWHSMDQNIATINSTGELISLAPGRVNVTFTETASGCVSSLPGDGIKVINCLDPDFNVTFINHNVTGNVRTNDDMLVSPVYGSPILIKKPASSIETLTLNPNGSYTFVGNKIGVYEYSVPVCLENITLPCPSSLLTITVADPYDHNNTIVVNTDFATTYKLSNTIAGKPVQISVTQNDVCLNDQICTLNPNSITFTALPAKGSILNTAGIVTYTPFAGQAGQEAVTYIICSIQNPSNCNTATQLVTINAENALNSSVGVDDFKVGMKGRDITGNVLLNDSDPENDAISVVPQGSAGSSVIIPEGSYYILSNGNYVFTPSPDFTGPVDIVYTVCDNNVSPYCTNATLHLLVMPHMRLYAKVYLEGALMRNDNTNGPDGKPLMRDQLRNSPFTGLNCIPVEDPYQVATPYTNLAAKFQHYGSGLHPEYLAVHDSAAMFSVSDHNAIVDWVFVELRSKSNNRMLLATRAGLLQRDGDIIDVDGQLGLEFPGIRKDSFYVVIRHRNHLGVMSEKVPAGKLVDFTSLETPVFNFGTSLNNGYNYTGLSQKKTIALGYQAMWAGDFDSNGRIKFTNPNDDHNILYFEVLSYPFNVSNTSNYNFVHGYIQSDYDMNSKAKYDNPNDDKNYLFSQLLLYPLNADLLSNFNFVLQQVPSVLGNE